MKRKELSRRDFLKGVSAGAASLAVLELLPATAVAEGETEEISDAGAEAAAEGEVDVLDMEIICVDRFVTKPGQGKEFLDYFLSEYREKAESYGMSLERTIVAPSLWLDNASNTIEISWSIAGFNGWAAMVNASRYDNATLDF